MLVAEKSVMLTLTSIMDEFVFSQACGWPCSAERGFLFHAP
jgi:hypothetical protein